MLGVNLLELKWAIEEDGICSTIHGQGRDIAACRGGR
jgi:hypothetical protein